MQKQRTARRSDGAPATPRRRGRWAQLRGLFAYLAAFDAEDLSRLVAKFEANQRDIQASQQRLAALFQAHASVPFTPPLISPLELATADRFELENRCRAMTNPIYVGGHTALCRILGSYKLFVDTEDVGFGSHVVLDGYWETWITIFVARQLKPGMTAIDGGANYGYYTLLFAALVGEAGRVYAIEPNPGILPNLRKSVELNGFTPRTTIIGAAAGAADGAEVFLFAPRGEPKNGTVVASPELIPPEAGTVHAVPQVSLDRSSAGATRVDFVKIDAEGAEEDVIAGMMGILERDRPGLLLEFNAARYRDPRAFLDRVAAVYNRMRYIDYAANAVPAAADQIVGSRWGEDWLLYFDQAAPGQ